MNQHLYTNTVLDGSVILFVRYRNHFPVVQFQNQAHIRNPHGMDEALIDPILALLDQNGIVCMSVILFYFFID